MITILTATYNRSYIIDALYNSLCNQTSHNFEWIVIDDGSSDDTYQKLMRYKTETTSFPITILRQQNKGKHCAINKGIREAKGEFCFIVDSDDYLSTDAIETIIDWTNGIRLEPHICGVAGLKGYIGKLSKVGQYPILPSGVHYIDAKNTERRRKKLEGDKAEIYRTDILRRFYFKEFPGENFLSEATLWDEIAYNGYSLRWYDKIIYYCEYLEDGLTNRGNEKEVRNFNGFTYFIQQRIKCRGKLDGLIARGYFLNVSHIKGLSVREAASQLGSNVFTLWCCNKLWKFKEMLLRK